MMRLLAILGSCLILSACQTTSQQASSTASESPSQVSAQLKSEMTQVFKVTDGGKTFEGYVNPAQPDVLAVFSYPYSESDNVIALGFSLIKVNENYCNNRGKNAGYLRGKHSLYNSETREFFSIFACKIELM